METTFILRESDLNEDFLEALRRLFKRSRQIQINAATSEDFDLYKKETSEQYEARLDQAITNLKEKRGVVLDEDQLDQMLLDHA